MRSLKFTWSSANGNNASQDALKLHVHADRVDWFGSMHIFNAVDVLSLTGPHGHDKHHPHDQHDHHHHGRPVEEETGGSFLNGLPFTHGFGCASMFLSYAELHVQLAGSH